MSLVLAFPRFPRALHRGGIITATVAADQTRTTTDIWKDLRTHYMLDHENDEEATRLIGELNTSVQADERKPQ